MCDKAAVYSSSSRTTCRLRERSGAGVEGSLGEFMVVGGWEYGCT